MKRLNLTVSTRNETGRGSCRRLRAAGKIPAVVYGISGSRNLVIGKTDFIKLWKAMLGLNALIDLTEEGKDPVLTIMQEVERNPTTDQFQHIDFLEVSADKPITTHTSIHVIGESQGVKIDGGLLETHVHEIEINCLPDDLPEFIEIDVTELRTGSAIHIGDIKAVSGVTFTGNKDTAIVSCLTPKGAKEEEEEAADKEAAAAAAAAAPEAEPATS